MEINPQDRIQLSGDDFTLLSDEMMDRLRDMSSGCSHPENIVEFNMCPECRTAMNSIGGGYECASCGLTLHIDGDVKDCDEESVSNLKMMSGRKVYNISSDYSRTQKKSILEQLLSKNQAYNGPKIPKDVLMRAAVGYNEIQKKVVLDELDEDGNVCKQKKFVKRGNIKDEILGAFVYFECIRAKITRKKKDIAVFMQLQNNGISRGEDILRSLANRGEINLPINNETRESFIDRYLEALNIESDRNRDFINDLVTASIEKKIGMNSVMSSKIVGALWILVVKDKLKITPEQIQDKCDNIKKNTWLRFSNAILANIIKFIGVFEKHRVDHGLHGKIIKKTTLPADLNPEAGPG
jgi:hypothetical protein